MAGEDFENHWRLLAWAIETLLKLSPGEYPPISYEQTYSAVYKCVCQGYAEDLYKRLLEEMEIHLNVFSERLQASSENELIESFNNTWVHFSGGISGIVPIFNYMARFYVETKLNLNLRLELTKIFDVVVVQPTIKRLVDQLRYVQHAPLGGGHAGTVENVVRALYTLRPGTVTELPDLCRRFMPELSLSVHLEELPDLPMNTRHEMNSGQSTSGESRESGRCRPFLLRHNHSCDLPIRDNSMDFNVQDDVGANSASETVSDPVICPVRRAKRRRSSGDSGEELGGITEGGLNVSMGELPQPSGTLENCLSKHRLRKHYHCDTGTDH